MILVMFVSIYHASQMLFKRKWLLCLPAKISEVTEARLGKQGRTRKWSWSVLKEMVR